MKFLTRLNTGSTLILLSWIITVQGCSNTASDAKDVKGDEADTRRMVNVEVEKIHACQSVCMLFYKDDAMLEECRVCGTSRYKQNDKNIDEDDMGENKKLKECQLRWYGISP